MPYILEAKSASLLAAGVPENQDDRAIQQHLALIESAIRHAAANGHNRVPLLGKQFAGWNKNDIRTGPLFMSRVFKALTEAGYTFHTKTELEITCESGSHRVPYVHTVVTWPKGQRLEAQTELTLEERTEIADSLGKDLEYVDPSFAQPTMPSKGVFPPTTLPAPGTPMQLIEYLRQKGYKMQGFGCLVEVKHKPTNWDTCRAIGSLVLNLLEVHRSGSPKEPTTASLSLAEYPDVDFKYLRGTFAEVGLLVHQKGDTLECRWPVSAWDYFPIAPVTSIEGDW